MTFQELWWCSAIARLDARDAQRGMIELTRQGGRVRTSASIVIPPEEVTTFNLARQLTSMGLSGRLQVTMALHAKALEGALRGRVGSGADLQLAIEVTRDEWVHLVIQAKRFYEDGTYKQWHTTQLGNLRTWAAAAQSTPAVMLYNTELPPFGPLGSIVELGGCCRRAVTRHGWAWPRWTEPEAKSPLGITLAVLPPVSKPLPVPLDVDGPAVAVVNGYAAPLECLTCPRFANPAPTDGGPTEPARQGCVLPRSPRPPGWAEELERIIGARRLGLALDEEEVNEELERLLGALVLPSPEDLEEEDDDEDKEPSDLDETSPAGQTDPSDQSDAAGPASQTRQTLFAVARLTPPDNG